MLQPTESVHTTNLNPLKLSFSVEVWDNILTYTLSPSLVIITLWQIFYPYTNACRQLVAHCASTFNCRLWRNLRTGEHISRLECIICSNILYKFSVLFIVSCWYNTVFVYNVPFWPKVISYNHRLFNPPSACLHFKYCSTAVINSIMIHTIFVLPKYLRISYMSGVFMEWSQKQHPSISYVLIHTIAVATGISS